MANYYSDVTDPTPDSYIRAYGCTVTITDLSVWPPLSILEAANGGTVILKNDTQIGQAVRVGSTKISKDTDRLIIEGNLIELGTGTGLPDQTITHWSTYYCPAVFIETAAGSGIYETYSNIIRRYGTSTYTLDSYGEDYAGRVFSQSNGNSTLTFGGVGGGKYPPDGAKIKVPNIVISAYEVGVTHTLDSATNGYFKSQGVQWSDHFAYINAAEADIQFYNSSITDLNIGAANSFIFNNSGLSNSNKGEIRAVKSLQIHNSQVLNIISSDSLLMENISGLDIDQLTVLIRPYNPTIETARSLNLVNNIGLSGTIKDLYACGAVTLTGKIIIDGLHIRPSQKEQTSSNNSFTLVNFDAFDGSIINIDVPADGGVPYGKVFSALSPCGDVIIEKLNILCSTYLSIASLYKPANNVVYKDWFVEGVTNRLFRDYLLYNSLKIENIRTNTIVFSGVRYFSYQTTTLKAVSDDNVYSYKNSMFHHILNGGTNTGKVTFKPASYTISPALPFTLLGSATYGSSITLSSLGDGIEMEIPFKLYGITSITSIQYDVMDWSTMFSEVSIDSGSGFGPYIGDLSTLTLPDPTIGFRMKIRSTMDIFNTEDGYELLRSLWANVVMDPTVLYPSDFTTLAFSGLPIGTDIFILEAGTTNILEQVDQHQASLFSWDYQGTPTVDVGFIRPGYVPYYIRNLALTTDNTTIPVSLVHDRNYA